MMWIGVTFHIILFLQHDVTIVAFRILLCLWLNSQLLSVNCSVPKLKYSYGLYQRRPLLQLQPYPGWECYLLCSALTLENLLRHYAKALSTRWRPSFIRGNLKTFAKSRWHPADWLHFTASTSNILLTICYPGATRREVLPILRAWGCQGVL